MPRARKDAGSAAAMLARMERMLARALSRAETAMEAAGESGGSAAGAKSIAEIVSLIARTVEKIHDMKRMLASEALAAGAAGPTEAERATLRRQVQEWIEARAHERAAELVARGAAERDRNGRAELDGDRSDADPASPAGNEG
ncbi:MAG: hypothetical protein ACTHJ3_00065 [Pararhizobium sp.]